MNSLLVTTITLLASQATLATALPGTNIRVKAYELDAMVVSKNAKVEAVARVTFDPLQLMPEELVFYLDGGLHVDSVFLGLERLATTSTRVPYDLDNFGMATRTTAVVTEEMMLDDGLTVFYSGHSKPSFLWLPVFQENYLASYPVDFTRVTVRSGEHYSEWCAEDVDFKKVQLKGLLAPSMPPPILF
jgi:hypothetical protein